jgi:hypothetical protein
VDIDTSIQPAPTRFNSREEYREFVSKVILHRHLERLPTELQREFIDEVVAQAAGDNPSFELDYWRLNLRALRPA